MEWLNYHHLLYFWLVAREGGLAAAAAKVHLTHPTIHAQIRSLESSLGERLFVKQGRKLVLTEMGRMVYGYADEIFSLGRELQDAVKTGASGRPARLVVGIADVIPKLIARRLLEPVLALDLPVQLVCREETADRLLLQLAAHELDVVLSDAPVASGSGVRAFSHVLGECETTFFAAPALAARCRKDFPESLQGQPVLLPTGSGTRRALDEWFDAKGLRPAVVAEFDDSALLKVFGQGGLGVFAAPSAIEEELVRQHDVEVVGRCPEIRARYWALSVERRLKHPAVVAILEGARRDLFVGASRK